MAGTAGSYRPGVPTPGDTTAPDAATVAGSSASFDELTALGVPPAMGSLPVPWGTQEIPHVPSAGWATPEIPAHQGPLTKTYQESVKWLYDQPPEIIGQLQQSLIAGGYMGKNPDYVPNAPDKKTYAVWNDILDQSMRSGKTPTEIISAAVTANGGLEAGLKKHGGPAPGTVADVHLSHPDDIRMVAKQVSTKTLGRGWNNAQLDQFVKTYQAMQSQAGQASRDSGATVVNAPGLEAAAEAEARRQNPTAAGATDADGIMQMVMKSFSILGGGSGG